MKVIALQPKEHAIRARKYNENLPVVLDRLMLYREISRDEYELF